MPTVKLCLGKKHLLLIFFKNIKPITEVAYLFNISSKPKLFVWGKFTKSKEFMLKALFDYRGFHVLYKIAVCKKKIVEL